MENEMTKNWTFDHLGVVVADLDKALEFYKSLGIADFPPPPEQAGPPPVFKEITSYGKPFVKDGKLIASNEGSRTRLQRWWVGSVQLEVIEPGDAVKEVNRDIFEKAGPGIAHIAYSISQKHYEEEVAKMTATGLDIVLKGTIKQGRGFTYFDARDRGGLLIELMSNPKKS